MQFRLWKSNGYPTNLTPDEKFLYEEISTHVQRTALTGFWVGAIAAAYWIDSIHVLDRETGLLIGAFASVPLFLGLKHLSDRIGDSAARASLEKRRPAPQVSLSAAPEATAQAHARVKHYELPGGYYLTSEVAARRMWAGYEGLPDPVQATTADVDKYWLVHDDIMDDPAYVGMATAMIAELRSLMARVILNHRREGEFFRDEPVDVVADQMRYLAQKR